MNNFRNLAVEAEACQHQVEVRGQELRSIGTRVDGAARQRLDTAKRLENQLIKKAELVKTSDWTEHRNEELTQKLEEERAQLTRQIERETLKLRKVEAELESCEADLVKVKEEHHALEKMVMEDRRRYEQFLGLKCGSVKTGEIRFTFNHIDAKHPEKEFVFSIRRDDRSNMAVECDPEIGERASQIAANLNSGRVTIPQVICEIRSIFKAMVSTE